MPVSVTFTVIVTGHCCIEISAGRDNLYISGLINFLAFKFLFFDFKTESHDHNRNKKRGGLFKQEM